MLKIKKCFAILTVMAMLVTSVTGAAFAADDNDEFDLSLVFSPEVQLAVYVGGEWAPALSGTYGYGEKATVTVPAESGEESFSYWEADGSIISYNRTLSMTMNAHTELSAVYGAETQTAQSAAGFTSITRTNDGTEISLWAFGSPVSGTIEGAGIIYSTVTTGEDLVIGATETVQKAAARITNIPNALPESVLDENNCWGLKIRPDSAETVYHARAYMIVGGNTVYGDVKDIKLESLAGGVSLVGNPDAFDPANASNALENIGGITNVTFEPNGGDGHVVVQALPSGRTANLRANTFTREGYNFGGWATEPAGSTVYADRASVTLSSDITLYAHWTQGSGSGHKDNTPQIRPADNQAATNETTVETDGSLHAKELETSTNTTKNSDGTVTVTDTVKETLNTKSIDGATIETKTDSTRAETTGSRKNADGSVTDTVKVESTETVKETATDANGKKTVTETETKQNYSTSVTTVKNSDGSKNEKTESSFTETVTEKITDATGRVKESVKETSTEIVTNMTTSAGGSATGTSTSTITVKDENGKILSTAVTEAEIKVAADERGVTTTETAAITTTTDAAGNETVEKTVTTENKTPDGSTGTVVKDENGNILSQEITISQKEAEAARDEGRPAQSPLLITPVPEEKVNSTPPVQINLPTLLYDKDRDGKVSAVEMPKVEIGVTYTGPGVIAMIKDRLGKWLPIKECYEGSIIVPVIGSGEIVIADNTKTFSDVKTGSWCNEYVTFVTAREIFNGTGDGKFSPDASMSRAMLAQVLYNFARGAEAGNGAVFSDVKADSWYNDAVGWAYENNIVTGYGETFGVTNSISRQDLATILYRYAKAMGYDVSTSASIAGFRDAGNVAAYAKEAMEWAVGTDLIGGMPDGTLSPKGSATRAQVAAIMTRFVRNAK